MDRMRLLKIVLAFLVVTTLQACGGGGAAGAGTASTSTVGYTCKTFKTPALKSPGYSGSTTLATVGTGTLPSFAQDMLATMVTLDDLKAVVPLPYAQVPNSEACQDFDNSEVNQVLDERPDGSGYSYAAYHGYSPQTQGTNGEAFTLSGTAYAVFAPASAGSPQSETVYLIGFHVQVSGHMDVVLNGSFVLTAPKGVGLNPLSATGGSVSTDLLIQDNLRGRTIWADGLKYSDVLEPSIGDGEVERTLSGTLYDTELGGLRVSSVNPFDYILDYINQGTSRGPKGRILAGGPVEFAGATAAAGYFAPLTPLFAALALDDKGDGTWDESMRIDALTYMPDQTPYPSLNGPVPEGAVGNISTVATKSFPTRVDALRSYSPAGKFLTYTWSLLSKPGDSTLALTDVHSAVPGFTPDLPGTYLLSLTVSDGQTSNTEDVSVTTDPNASLPALEQPMAVAGPDMQAKVGQTVTVDGRASGGLDTDTWGFAWTLVAPPGSHATLSNTKTFVMAADDPTTSFVPDVPGFYTLVLHEGDSFGTFSEGTTVNVAVGVPLEFHRPATLVDSTLHTFGFIYITGDFNGDGIMDVATASQGTSGSVIKVYYGSHSGFTRTATIAVPGQPAFLRAMDVNGDGRTDIVVSTTGVYAILQQSDGTLGASVQIGAASTCITGGNPVLLFGVGPWNGASTNSVFTVLGTCTDIYGSTGPSTFASLGTGTNPVTHAFASTISIADVTGDGIADVVDLECPSLTNGVQVFPGQADGSFGAPVLYALPKYNDITCDLPVIGDLNGDGKLDAASLDGNAIDVFLQNGSQAFDAATHPSILAKPAGFSSFATKDLAGGDVDGDGREDLLVHHFLYPYPNATNNYLDVNMTYLGVLLQKKTGGFKTELLVPLGLEWGYGLSSYPMAVGDFNGDGHPDVVTEDGGGSLMVLYRKP